MTTATELSGILRERQAMVKSVLPYDLRRMKPAVFDFTEANTDLTRIDLNDTAEFSEMLFEKIDASGAPVGIGRFDEDRVLYRHSPLFDGRLERRSVHLGIDLFVEAGTVVSAPLSARVHSFADNATLGNYGPTVILEHKIDGVVFFSLYGHLGGGSLHDLQLRQRIDAGEQFATIGDLHENGGWPPHLHFQLMTDMLGNTGDFPGVAAPSERDRFLRICPDPNLVLGIPGL